jgi:hypothetical protein
MLVEQRKSVRLDLNKGFIRVRYCGVPAFYGTLIDISDGGCCCDATPDFYQSSDVEAWASVLTDGLLLHAEISIEHVLLRFHTDAVLAYYTPLDGRSVKLGLRFIQSSARTTQLRTALLSIAATQCFETGTAQAPEASGAPHDDSIFPHSEVRTTRRRSSIRKVVDLLFSKRATGNAIRPAASLLVKDTGSSAVRLLLQHQPSRPREVCQALAKQWSLPVTELGRDELPQKFQKIFSYLVLRRHEIVPFTESKERLCVAASRPLTEAVVNELEVICGRRLQVYLAPLDQIHHIQFKMRPRGPYQERHFARVRVRIPVNYSFIGGNGLALQSAIRGGFILNMSEGGFLIMGAGDAEQDPAELIERGATLGLEFLSEFGKVEAVCQVRHCCAFRQPPEEKLYWNMGLEIVSILRRDADALKDACAHVAIDRMKNRALCSTT